MADIVVGTCRIDFCGVRMPGLTDEAVAEAGFDWVRVGDAVITSAKDLLVSVKYEIDGASVATVTIRVIASSFRTVDSRETETGVLATQADD